MDNNLCVGAVFVDLKAFDTVDHNILLHKMEHIGFRGNALKLIKSYLCNRLSCVSINNVISDKKCISYGVPQGSILGPLFFNI